MIVTTSWVSRDSLSQRSDPTLHSSCFFPSRAKFPNSPLITSSTQPLRFFPFSSLQLAPKQPDKSPLRRGSHVATATITPCLFDLQR